MLLAKIQGLDGLACFDNTHLMVDILKKVSKNITQRISFFEWMNSWFEEHRHLPCVKFRVAFTGHRPNGLPLDTSNVENFLNETIKYISYFVQSFNSYPSTLISECRFTDEYITGGALGVDTYAAELAIVHRKPLHLFLPFEGMDKLWCDADKETLKKHISYAKEMGEGSLRYVTPGGFSNYAYQRRNEDMVNSADLLIAVWDGNGGGTANCVRYAKESSDIPILFFNPVKETVDFYHDE